MANSIKILELLKWYTDEDHPITQENLRKKPNANQYMGYKTTFKRHLFEIADTYNLEAESEEEWRIVFPGYDQKKNITNPNSKHYTGPIYYRHEIKKHELDFLMEQIQYTQQLSPEDKEILSQKLKKLLGSVHYNQPNDSAENRIEVCMTYNDEVLSRNLIFLRKAIHDKKMIDFNLLVLNESGSYVLKDDTRYRVSPYSIILYNGKYWLIGNRRLGRYHSGNSMRPKYSDTLDIYRIDKLTNLSIARETLEISRKDYANISTNLKCLEKIMIFSENEQIHNKLINHDLGKIEFEIVWDYFPPGERYDYSFIKDTFGTNYSISEDSGHIFCIIRSTDKCFIDWAVRYADKIRILNTFPTSNKIKEQLKRKLEKGLSNLL